MDNETSIKWCLAIQQFRKDGIWRFWFAAPIGYDPCLPDDERDDMDSEVREVIEVIEMAIQAEGGDDQTYDNFIYAIYHDGIEVCYGDRK